MIRYVGWSHPDPCQHCKGKGRISRRNIQFECTSCNGTGIRGNPGCLMWIILASIVGWCSVLAYFVLR